MGFFINTIVIGLFQEYTFTFRFILYKYYLWWQGQRLHDKDFLFEQGNGRTWAPSAEGLWYSVQLPSITDVILDWLSRLHCTHSNTQQREQGSSEYQSEVRRGCQQTGPWVTCAKCKASDVILVITDLSRIFERFEINTLFQTKTDLRTWFQTGSTVSEINTRRTV